MQAALVIIWTLGNETRIAVGVSVREADACVFVTPEYNFGATPALISALDYVYPVHEGREIPGQRHTPEGRRGDAG